MAKLHDAKVHWLDEAGGENRADHQVKMTEIASQMSRN